MAGADNADQWSRSALPRSRVRVTRRLDLLKHVRNKILNLLDSFGFERLNRAVAAVEAVEVAKIVHVLLAPDAADDAVFEVQG